MAFKIEKINNSLVVTETNSGKEIIDTPSNLVYYDVDELDSRSNIRFKNISSTDSVHSNFPTMPLNECLTSDNVAFTIITFKTFARTNLG